MTRKRVRANGEGSIYKRGADGIWVAAAYLPNGRRKAVYGRTKGEAVRKLEELKSAVAAGGAPKTDERQTVEQYMALWFTTARAALRPSSARLYESMIRTRIVPALGRRRLSKVTTYDLEQFFGQVDLAPRSVRLIKNILSSAYTDAVRWGYIGHNPVTYAVAPKVVKSEGLAIEPSEARAIMAAFAGGPLEHLVATAVGSGLRQGELLGLAWPDIDFDKGTVQVRKTLQHYERTFERMEPKTSRSNRIIPVAPFALDALRRQLEFQTMRRLVSDDWVNDLGLVFTTDTGRPIAASAVRQAFATGLANAGLRKRRFHDLRHAYATLLLAQGVELTTIMEMLGHTELQTSLIYTHVVSDLKRDAARKLGDLLG